jgi:hypothetical protein
VSSGISSSQQLPIVNANIQGTAAQEASSIFNLQQHGVQAGGQKVKRKFHQQKWLGV